MKATNMDNEESAQFKSEGRGPKSERNPKVEIRTSISSVWPPVFLKEDSLPSQLREYTYQRGRFLVLRISDFFRISAAL